MIQYLTFLRPEISCVCQYLTFFRAEISCVCQYLTFFRAEIDSASCPISTNSSVPMDDQLTLLDGRVRFYIFLFISLCGGLPALVLAAWTLHQHRRLRIQSSIFIITLLFNDAVELLLIPFIVAATASTTLPLCPLICPVFLCVRFLGLYLHQMVALEGILGPKHPRCSALLSSVPCYLVLLTLTIVLAVTTVFATHALHAVLFAVPVVVMVTTSVLVCPVNISSRHTAQRDRPDCMVLIVSLVTFLCFYGPFLLTLPLFHYNESLPFLQLFPSPKEFASVWETMSLSVMSLRVIADPLLCVLVCRLPRMQLSQTGEASA